MLKCVLLTLSLSGIIANAFANDRSTIFNQENVKSIHIAAPNWEGYTNPDGTGLYWEVLKAIYEPAQIEVKTATVPWNRAMPMVTKYHVYNAIVGEQKTTKEDLIFPDYPIDVEYLTALSMAGRNLSWHGVASLKNKKVGWMKGYKVIPKEKQNFELIEYRTLEQGLKMLEVGELDYLIDEWDEISSAVSEAGHSMTRYSMNEMPEGTDIYVGFVNTPMSQMLIAVYNERMKTLYIEKKLVAIYEKWDAILPATTRSLLNQ